LEEKDLNLSQQITTSNDTVFTCIDATKGTKTEESLCNLSTTETETLH
jgi:hypothetical protein